MKIFTFLRKNGDPPKRVVDFLQERDTFRNKIMEIVEDFDEKSYNNNGKPWKFSRILRVIPNFFIFFLFFIIFLYFSFFFHFFIFFIFSFCFIFFHFPSYSFIFFHFLSFSFTFFHFLSFSFIFFLFLSFLFISFHFRSFSFIFVHFISFCFILFHFISFYLIFHTSHFFIFASDMYTNPRFSTSVSGFSTLPPEVVKHHPFTTQLCIPFRQSLPSLQLPYPDSPASTRKRTRIWAGQGLPVLACTSPP